MIDEMSPAEYQQRLRSGELWQLLDVREVWETEVSRVAQAIHIPMSDVPDRVEELDRDRPIAVLCHSGVRSARVASFLAHQGFASVANIAGGIDAWSVEVDSSIPRY